MEIVEGLTAETATLNDKAKSRITVIVINGGFLIMIPVTEESA